ncbi:hypothetical protein GSU0958 [Geobacter sulfurreducens PCA]|uniref:Uncharacterized protein n=1 Tax=Geobacter sulfurreducens (strain ATCC 51573 / DSM 12127 / PCA) TaxID=243231 RepID=Q74EK4_GEOSL|nr:hypothetical protein GSU0958 [Geobacter sulfurreducens PCA]
MALYDEKAKQTEEYVGLAGGVTLSCRSVAARAAKTKRSLLVSCSVSEKLAGGVKRKTGKRRI